MKKTLKAILFVLVSAITLGAFACGKNNNNDLKADCIQIYVAVNSDGYTAKEWLDTAAKNFNKHLEDRDVKYEIVVEDGEFNILGTLGDQIKSGYSQYTVYYSADSRFFKLIEDGTLLDVSDVYEMTAYTDNKKIKDRMTDYDLFTSYFKSFSKDGIYAVPYVSGLSGLVFDYQYFLDRGYLDYAPVSALEAINNQNGETVAQAEGENVVVTKAFGNYKVGDYVLTAGKDGKYGTYDDGQRTTLKGFENLLEEMITKSPKKDVPFIFTNQYPGYLTPFVNSVMAQYMGIENYTNFGLLEGDIKGKDGSVQAKLTMQNGASAWDTAIINDSYRAAGDYFYNYILGNKATVGSTAAGRNKLIWEYSRTGNSFSHLSAQNNFLQSYAAELGDVAQPAFLVEGTYWENEAKKTMNRLGEGRRYGEREYRLYLTPSFEGQITPEDQTVFASSGISNGVLINNFPNKSAAGVNMREASEEKKAEFIGYAKEFLAYTMSEEMCKYYTAYTGIKKPFEYSLSEEQLANLTPFQRNIFEMESDTEHIKRINLMGLYNKSLVRCYGINNLTCVTYESPYNAFMVGNKTIDSWISGIKDTVNGLYKNALKNAVEYLKK